MPRIPYTQKWNLVILAILLLIIATVLVVASVRERALTNQTVADPLLSEVMQYEDSVLRSSQQADSLKRASYRKRHRYYSNSQHYYTENRYYHNDKSPVETDGQSNTDAVKADHSSDFLYGGAQRTPLIFELNSADTLDLQQLRGIGPVYASRIVRYREALGGFYNIEQLKEVYGFTPELYASVTPYLTLDSATSSTTIRKIHLNTATLNELKHHPYLDYYQAKAIVNYRRQGGTFTTINDLLKVTLIDEKTFHKLKPYLSI